MSLSIRVHSNWEGCNDRLTRSHIPFHNLNNETVTTAQLNDIEAVGRMHEWRKQSTEYRTKLKTTWPRQRCNKRRTNASDQIGKWKICWKTHKVKEYNRLSAIEWINTNLMKSWLTSHSTIAPWGGKNVVALHTHTTKMAPIMEWQIVHVCVARSLPYYIAVKFSCGCVRPWWFIWSFDCLSSVPFHQYFSFDLSVRDKYSFVSVLLLVDSLVRTKWFHTTWMPNLTHPSVIQFFFFVMAELILSPHHHHRRRFFFLFIVFHSLSLLACRWLKRCESHWEILLCTSSIHTHERMAKEHVKENKSKALSR